MDWREISNHDINIYSTPWCSDCRRLKDRLIEHGVSFEEINIDDDANAADFLAKKTGHKAIPYIEIDKKWLIRGWHKEKSNRWDDRTFFEEIKIALKA